MPYGGTSESFFHILCEMRTRVVLICFPIPSTLRNKTIICGLFAPHSIIGLISKKSILRHLATQKACHAPFSGRLNLPKILPPTKSIKVRSEIKDRFSIYNPVSRPALYNGINFEEYPLPGDHSPQQMRHVNGD